VVTTEERLLWHYTRPVHDLNEVVIKFGPLCAQKA